MSVVRINAISVPAERPRSSSGGSPRGRARSSTSPGFEAFELLRPTDDKDVYLVYTRWRSQADFDAWVSSPAFTARPPRSPHAGTREQPQRALVVRRRAARGAGAPAGGAHDLPQLSDFHMVWGYVAIVANGLVGLAGAARVEGRASCAGPLALDRDDRRPSRR